MGFNELSLCYTHDTILTWLVINLNLLATLSSFSLVRCSVELFSGYHPKQSNLLRGLNVST